MHRDTVFFCVQPTHRTHAKSKMHSRLQYVMPGGIHDFTTAEIEVKNAKLAKKKKNKTTAVDSLIWTGLCTTSVQQCLRVTKFGLAVASCSASHGDLAWRPALGLLALRRVQVSRIF